MRVENKSAFLLFADFWPILALCANFSTCAHHARTRHHLCAEFAVLRQNQY